MSEERRAFWDPDRRQAYLDQARQKSEKMKRQQNGVPVAEELEALWMELTDDERALLEAMVTAGRRSLIALHDHPSLRGLVARGILTYPQGHGGNWMRAARTSYAVPRAIWEKLRRVRRLDDPAMPSLSTREAEELLAQVTAEATRTLLETPTREVQVFRPNRLHPPIDKVLRLAGYKELGRVGPKVRAMAETIVDLAVESSRPAVHFRRIGVSSCSGDRLQLEDGTAFSSPAFGKHMARCHEVIAFILTLGAGFDASGKELARDDKVVELLFHEAAGHLCVEQATRHFLACLKEWAAGEAFEVGRRLSPGYSYRVGREKCLWPIEDQRGLFGLFPPGSVPVTLLEGCAMVPKMSRSGLFGLRPGTSDAAEA